jgi:hypothetical protein
MSAGLPSTKGDCDKAESGRHQIPDSETRQAEHTRARAAQCPRQQRESRSDEQKTETGATPKACNANRDSGDEAPGGARRNAELHAIVTHADVIDEFGAECEDEGDESSQHAGDDGTTDIVTVPKQRDSEHKESRAEG